MLKGESPNFAPAAARCPRAGATPHGTRHHRPQSPLLGLVRSGARDHRAFVGTPTAVRGGPLGRRRVRAEGDDPPQPSPRWEDEDRGLDREPEAGGMLRAPFHRARSQPWGDEASMKPTRAERGFPYSPNSHKGRSPKFALRGFSEASKKPRRRLPGQGRTADQHRLVQERQYGLAGDDRVLPARVAHRRQLDAEPELSLVAGQPEPHDDRLIPRRSPYLRPMPELVLG